jgi:hypothetical protein
VTLEVVVGVLRVVGVLGVVDGPCPGKRLCKKQVNEKAIYIHLGVEGADSSEEEIPMVVP